MSAVNPYAPPKAHVQDVVEGNSDAESVRQEYLKQERSVRSIGILYYVGGPIMLLVGIGLLVSGSALAPFASVVGVFYVAIGALSLAVARGLRTLRPWARIACIVISSIGLLGFPIGTLINAYLLYLMLAKRSQRLFEDDYAAIVAATPHIKTGVSLFVWIVLGIFFTVIIGGILAAIFIPMMNR